MSMTAVPISIRVVRAPIAASSGNGDASCCAKWWTRKYAPSAPRSSTASASSMDWMSASEAERTCEYGAVDQCPNERNPIFFTSGVYGLASERSTTDGIAAATSGLFGLRRQRDPRPEHTADGEDPDQREERRDGEREHPRRGTQQTDEQHDAGRGRHDDAEGTVDRRVVLVVGQRAGQQGERQQRDRDRAGQQPRDADGCLRIVRVLDQPDHRRAGPDDRERDREVALHPRVEREAVGPRLPPARDIEEQPPQPEADEQGDEPGGERERVTLGPGQAVDHA